MGPSGGTGGDLAKDTTSQLLVQQLDVLNRAMEQLQQQQAALQQLQPQIYQMLSQSAYSPESQAVANATISGQPVTNPNPAPTPVENPGEKPVEYRTVFNGKDWGKNDQAKQDQSLKDIAAWEQKNQAYQSYLQQKQTYDAWTPAAITPTQQMLGQTTGSLYTQIQQTVQGMQQTPEQVDQLKGALAAIRTPDGFFEGMDQIVQGLKPNEEWFTKLNGVIDQLQVDPNLQAQLVGLANSINPTREQTQALLNAVAGGEVSRENLSTDELQQLTIHNLAIRSEAASRGELSPEYNQALQKEFDAQAAEMAKNLGPGWASSTPGLEYFRNKSEATSTLARADLGDLIANLNSAQTQRTNQIGSQFNTLLSAEQARRAGLGDYLNALLGAEDTRRTQLMQYGQGVLGTEAARAASASDWYNALLGQQQFQLQQAGGLANLLLGLQGGTQNVSGMGAELYTMANQLPYQSSWSQLLSMFPGLTTGSANVAQSQYKQQGPSLFSQIMGPTMQAVGTGGGILAAAKLSDRRMKTNMRKLGVKVAGLPVWEFRYLFDDGLSPLRIGFMADEVKELYPQHVINIGGYDHVNYLGVLAEAN